MCDTAGFINCYCESGKSRPARRTSKHVLWSETTEVGEMHRFDVEIISLTDKP